MKIPSKDQLKPLGIRIKPETKEWLTREAEKQERSVNWMVNKVLDDAKAAQSEGEK